MLEELGERVPLILDGGACAVGIESTIVDCSRNEPVVLRPGHIAPAHLEAVREVVSILKNAVQDLEADGTYSQEQFRLGYGT